MEWFTFSFTENRDRNFVPAYVIIDYAKEHHLDYYWFYDVLILKYRGDFFRYSHFIIDHRKDGTETVTIFLRKYD